MSSALAWIIAFVIIVAISIGWVNGIDRAPKDYDGSDLFDD